MINLGAMLAAILPTLPLVVALDERVPSLDNPPPPRPPTAGCGLVEPYRGAIFFVDARQGAVEVMARAMHGLDDFGSLELRSIPTPSGLSLGYLPVAIIGCTSKSEIRRSTSTSSAPIGFAAARTENGTCLGSEGVALVGPKSTQYFSDIRLRCVPSGG